jgi:hypothetical protein
MTGLERPIAAVVAWAMLAAGCAGAGEESAISLPVGRSEPAVGNDDGRRARSVGNDVIGTAEELETALLGGLRTQLDAQAAVGAASTEPQPTTAPQGFRRQESFGGGLLSTSCCWTA